MAFKQVCRKSSLFRPWSPAVEVNTDISLPIGNTTIAGEDPLQSLKSFVVKESKRSGCEKSQLTRLHDETKVRLIPDKTNINKCNDATTNSIKDLHFSFEVPNGISPRIVQYPPVSDFKTTNSVGILPIVTPTFTHSQEMHDFAAGVPMGFLNRNSMLGLGPNTKHTYGSHGLDSVVSSLHPASWDNGSSPSVLLPMLPSLTQSLENPSSQRWRTKKQRPKRFQCPHCQVSFSNNGQLKGHVRIHTGERPFACDHPTCGKTFTRNEELTRHKRIHTGVRPYPCPLCGKRFGRKDHLKKHVKTHQRTHLHALPPSAASAFQGLHYFVGEGMPWF